jgi:hypothetical protein
LKRYALTKTARATSCSRALASSIENATELQDLGLGFGFATQGSISLNMINNSLQAIQIRRPEFFQLTVAATMSNFG